MIKGLVRRLNEAGKIKIGKKSENELPTKAGGTFRPPERLDHFIVTTTEKDANGDLVVDKALMKALSEDQDTVKNEKGEIIGIPIRLIYDDTELNFPTRLAAYEKGILTCYGDGETAYSRLSDFKTPKQCPCSRLDSGECKYNGKLTCVIDAAGMFGQVHVFRTTSFNSVHGIIGGIELVKTATGGKIAGLPLMLMLNNKSTTIPKTGQPTTIQVVSVCYRGTMSSLQKKCLQMASENAQFLLGMQEIERDARNMGVCDVVSDEEDKDFQEEFYPESIVNDPVKVEHASEHAAGPEKDGVIDAVVVAHDHVVDGQKTEPVSTKTATEPETFNTRDVMTQEMKDLAKESQEKTEKEMAQVRLFNRAITEYNQIEAGKIVKRLDKAYLIKFIETTGTDEDMPLSGANKPEYVDSACRIINSDDWIKIVSKIRAEAPPADETPVNDEQDEKALEKTETQTVEIHPDLADLAKITDQKELVDAMRKKFPDVVINGTLPIDGLLKRAQQIIEDRGKKIDPVVDHVDEKTPEIKSVGDVEDNPFAWDDGPPIQQDPTLQTIAYLKSKLKINDKTEWNARVSMYLDKAGNPLPLAAHMTEKQARHFQSVLQNELDGIPF